MEKSFRSRARTLVVAVAVLTAVAPVTGGLRHANAASTTPAKGSWTWCTDAVRNGCLEAVTTVSPQGATATYTEAAQMPQGLSVTATCSMNGGTGDLCNSNKFDTGTSGPCRERDDWTRSVIVPSVEMDVVWPGRNGWSTVARFSTGDFRPAFLIGHGTTATRTTDDGDGTFTFELTSTIETTYSGSFSMTGPSGPDDQSVATSVNESVHVQLWPRDHLIVNNSLSPSTNGCSFYPFTGAWAEANAQGFSWSYSAGAGASSTAPNTLKFTAYAPHFKPRVGDNPLELNPARVQVFLPTSYFNALGYASLDEFDASSYSVATEDGQTTTPSVTKRSDGLLINLGISHYSAPNPSVTFKVKGSAVGGTGGLPSTSPVTVPKASTAPTTVIKMKKSASVSLSTVIRHTGSGKKSWRASGGCTIKGTRLVAPARRTTCTVVLTVRNAKGMTIATKKATVRVT